MADTSIMVQNEEVMVLTKEGLTTLAKEILESVNERISERIVNVMNDGSDGHHVPSAELVWNSIQGISKLRNVMVKSGDINEAKVIKDEQTLYVLRTSLTEQRGTPYVWRKDVGFISLGGSTTVGSTGDGINIVAMSKSDIVSAVQSAANQTKPDFSDDSVNPNPPVTTDPDDNGDGGDENNGGDSGTETEKPNPDPDPDPEEPDPEKPEPPEIGEGEDDM